MSSPARGTHLLGSHVDIVAASARQCQPATATPDQAKAMLHAATSCMDLVGGTAQAVRPRAASPAQPVIGNRTRDNKRQQAPMNPVGHHYGGGRSGKPPGDSDAAYWKREFHRVSTHFDRCEVVRRAGHYLATLLVRDPNAPKGTFTEKDVETQIIVEGNGWPLVDVARRFRVTERTVALTRIRDQRHPLTGTPWKPPEHNTFAATLAREMKTAGMASVDIALALERNAATVRAWITSRRHAA